MAIVPIKEFKESEFACRCGKCNLGYSDMDEELLSKLFTARKEANVPFGITSAIRCEAHNEKEGGTHDSTHISGKAVDVSFSDNVDLWIKVKAFARVGMRRIGINFKKKFIHVDVDRDKPQGMFQYK